MRSARHIVNAQLLEAIPTDGSKVLMNAQVRKPAVSMLLSEPPSYYQAQSVFWLFKRHVLGRLRLRVWMKASFMDES